MLTFRWCNLHPGDSAFSFTFSHTWILDTIVQHTRNVGRDSAAGIATRYRLGGPGVESRWGRDFPHLSTPALGPPSLLYIGDWISFLGLKRSRVLR